MCTGSKGSLEGGERVDIVETESRYTKIKIKNKKTSNNIYYCLANMLEGLRPSKKQREYYLIIMSCTIPMV